MVNDVSRRIEAFNSTSAHAYSSTTVPPKVEQAARTGKLDVVQEFLDSGGDPNARTVYQSQLLHVAARHGQSDVLAALLKAPGIQVMALDYGGMRRTALHWACQRGDIRSVEALVAAGADITAQGKGWAKLVQGQRCGQLVQNDSPSEQSPADLCRDGLVRLALFQPQWCPDVHSEFPASFAEAVRVLVMAAASRHEQSAEIQPWPLSMDVTRSIIAAAAYPISAWSSLEQAQRA